MKCLESEISVCMQMDVLLQSVLQAFQFIVQQLESEHQVFLLSNRLLSTHKIFTVDQKKYAFFVIAVVFWAGCCLFLYYYAVK